MWQTLLLAINRNKNLGIIYFLCFWIDCYSMRIHMESLVPRAWIRGNLIRSSQETKEFHCLVQSHLHLISLFFGPSQVPGVTDLVLEVRQLRSSAS